jgi:diaminobutyrate-2-oxoglutarate transaminase
LQSEVFSRLESEVRGYCRNFPVVFDRAEGPRLYAESGRAYVDFFSGAGALNYGHNPSALRAALIAYLERGAVTHSLDMMTVAKRNFLTRFEQVILKTRSLDYKVQFPGPTGTNAVEAALKLARKVTGRRDVVSFTNAFHGMTLGALAVTGNAFKRQGAGVPLNHTIVMPYDNEQGIDSLALLESLLENSSSGVDVPAAVILETVQAEGGINVARAGWLRKLAELCRRHAIVLIVDDIQVGCGRTGPFFSFESAGIEPDMVCLSKSLSGYGLPLAVTLVRPPLDVWSPGEHNGTFRGHNPAFVTATAALDYWTDQTLERSVEAHGRHIESALAAVCARVPDFAHEQRGKGMIRGLVFTVPEMASRVAQAAFARGLIVETAGPRDEVLKIMPALTIDRATLDEGLSMLTQATLEVCESERSLEFVGPRRASEAAE